jgi:hypothetical protein
VVHALAFNDHDRWKKMGQTDPEFKDLKTKVEREEISAYALYGAGAAVLAGGLVWYFVDRGMHPASKAQKKAMNIEFQPLVGPVAGAMISGSW